MTILLPGFLHAQVKRFITMQTAWLKGTIRSRWCGSATSRAKRAGMRKGVQFVEQPERIATYAKLNTYQTDLFAWFLDKLAAAHHAGHLHFFGDHAALAERRAFAAYLHERFL